MSAYNQPTESLPSFNNEVFSQPIVNLSQAEADKLYLSKTKNDISTASSTTFNGTVNVGGMLDLTSGANTSELSQSGNTLTIANKVPSGSVILTAQTAGGTNQGITLTSGGLTMNNFIPLNTRIIRSTDTTSVTHSVFDNITTGSLQIGGAAGTNSIRGETTFTQNVNVTGQTLGCREIRFNDYSGIVGNQQQAYLSGTIFDFVALFNNNTYNFYCKNAGGTNQIAAIIIHHAGTTINNILTLASRLNFNVSSYTFPFSSNQSLGYYLKTTGTSQSVTSATPTTILTTSTIPIGVWRIDFSVQLTVGATGAGTIAQSQSYISTTLNGAVGTAVSFTGSILRSHTSEVYANNDIQVITSSITYNQSTAGVLYLNILRTFASGTYSFIGEVSITRLA